MVFRFILLLILGLSFACGDVEKQPAIEHGTEVQVSISEPIEIDMLVESDSSITYDKDEEWICHHPGTNMHNQVCINEEFPKGCYIKGDTHAFCWLLLRNDCENPGPGEWQQDVCHHLR